ncbi:MAG: KTSC domain-containing protein [Lyngbya sp.]|nr:KTSC domain-containing protein [Lyngbya sp.]
MDNFKSTELDEAFATPIEQTEESRQLEHDTFRQMLASGFQRNEEDITVNFGRRTVLGRLEDGSYRDEITSAKIDAVMDALGEDARPELLTSNPPFIEIKAQDEVLLRSEQNGEVTVNNFDLLRLFNREEQVTVALIEADAKLETDKPVWEAELDDLQQQLNQLYSEAALTGREELRELWEFNSSVLSFGLYERDTQELTLEFQSGKDYTYRNISPEVWEEFKEAESAGQFYNREIKGQYSVEKIGENLLNSRLGDFIYESVSQPVNEPDNPIVNESVTVEIPFLTSDNSPTISHPLEDFDTSSLKDFLNQEYQLGEQLAEIHRVDGGDKIDYEALKVVVEKAVENLYPEWDEADPELADEIKWYRMNDRSRELQVSTDLILEEIDSEARETAPTLNTNQPNWEPINPLTPIRFQTTDTGRGDSHFLDAVHQYDSRLLTENTGLSPSQVLVDEITLQDPNISGHSETQQWVYNTAQEIHQDVSQIRDSFVEQQRALVEEVGQNINNIEARLANMDKRFDNIDKSLHKIQEILETDSEVEQAEQQDLVE